MKKTSRDVTTGAELAMRVKLASLGGISYGQLSIWEKTHGEEFTRWYLEWSKLNEGYDADGLTFPEHLPQGFPERKMPEEHQWTTDHHNKKV